ncbi:MAG: type II toxin-antitoxin system VapC family toxin [Gemmatimonadales bacterium]
MIVLDASVVLEVILSTVVGRGLEPRLRAAGESWHAPAVLDLEVTQVLRRLARVRTLTSKRGAQAVADLADLPIRRYPHLPFIHRVWSMRRNLTAYDAAYVALAEELGAPLVTRDAKLAAAPGHRAVVELV